jgi:endonuclease-8
VPEGDVVLRTARRLRAALAGKVLITSDLRWPSLATADLTGREVADVVPAGKHLLIRMSGGLTLHSHLRMDGSWRVHPTGRNGAGPRRDHTIRAILANADWTAVGHRLGMLDLVATEDEDSILGHLGPDILGPDSSALPDPEPGAAWAHWDEDEALRRLLAQPQAPVGAALLDQRNLCGIGTLYRTEALFLHGVSPAYPVGSVPDLPKLLRLVRRIMQANLERVQQATTGDLRRGEEHWVHRRGRKPCRRCGTTIQRGALGPPTQERDTYWCPHCQPG